MVWISFKYPNISSKRKLFTDTHVVRTCHPNGDLYLLYIYFHIYIYIHRHTCGYVNPVVFSLCLQGHKLVAHRDAELSGLGLHHGLGELRELRGWRHGSPTWWHSLRIPGITSWYGKYPIIYRVFSMPGGAGFLPSTVGILVSCFCLNTFPKFNIAPEKLLSQ